MSPDGPRTTRGCRTARHPRASPVYSWKGRIRREGWGSTGPTRGMAASWGRGSVGMGKRRIPGSVYCPGHSTPPPTRRNSVFSRPGTPVGTPPASSAGCKRSETPGQGWGARSPTGTAGIGAGWSLVRSNRLGLLIG
ncbi:hypothetical protein K493DRAFT_393565, partial [Basidiobolus meristosporus CBS 931.73]